MITGPFSQQDYHSIPVSAGPDLRLGWPDWRRGRRRDLRKILDWPVEGALFDVQYNALWHPSSGQRPADMNTALGAARLHLARAQTMIPVYGHRYLPAGRGTYGHPVLSIYQTEIIIYGTDLANYIALEFHRPMIPDLCPAAGLDPAADDAVLERLPGRRAWLVINIRRARLLDLI